MEYVLNLECILCGILDTSVVFRAFGGLSFKIPPPSPKNNNKFCVVFWGVFSLPTKAIPPNYISRKKNLPEIHAYWLSVSV